MKRKATPQPIYQPPPPEVPRLAYCVEDAAAALSIGRDMVYKLIRAGRLRVVKAGGRTLVPVDAIREFLSGTPAA